MVRKMKYSKFLLYIFIASILTSCQMANERFTYLQEDTQGNKTCKAPDGYKTYTIFINPSYKYNNSIKDKIDALGVAFKSYSRSIGDNNQGLWCGTIKNNKYNLDASQGKMYSDKFNLNYNDGPYVIMTTYNPLSNRTPKDDAIIISFSDINPDRIINVLNALEQNISTNKPDTTTNITLEKRKQELWSIVDNNSTLIKELAYRIVNIKEK